MRRRRTDEELYRELVKSGTLPEDATAIVDAEILPLEEWREVHSLERNKNAQHLPDYERHY